MLTLRRFLACTCALALLSCISCAAAEETPAQPGKATTTNEETSGTEMDDRLLVDAYGQMIKAGFVEKVLSDGELQADAAADAAYYASLTPPERDAYGGLPGSKEKYGLQETGFFHIEKLDGKFVMVNPLGNLFFSVATSGVAYKGETHTLTTGREYLYQWLPDIAEDGGKWAPAFLNGNRGHFSWYVANKIRKDGGFTDAGFYEESVYRCKQWGFTSEGAWATRPVKGASPVQSAFPQYEFADLPEDFRIGTSGLFDIFHPTAPMAIEASFRAQAIDTWKDDPLIVGYFFGNEFQYQHFNLAVLGAKASQAATKGALVDMLAEKYKETAAFNEAWGTDFADFEALREAAVPLLNDAASQDMLAFFELYMDAFYRTVAEKFRALDPNHLLLGDRYLTSPMNNADIREAVSRAAGRYLDVISYNYYTDDIDLSRLKEMAEISGRPLLLTEFHFADPSQGLTGGIRMVENQEQKGWAYRNYVEKAAASGLVVGTHWFIYLDQAATGRWFQGYEGESFGIGLVNVADRPYKTMLESVMQTNYAIYDLVLGQKEPFQYLSTPVRDARQEIALPKAAAPMAIDGEKDAHWPSGGYMRLEDAHRVLGMAREDVSADIFLCWDAENLYILAAIKDATPRENAFTGFDIWNGDALELFVGPEAAQEEGPLRVKDSQLIISANGDYYWYNNRDPHPPITVAVKPHAGNPGYTIEAAVPLAALNIAEPASGTRIRFDIGFDNGEGNKRVAQYLWNGADGNAQVRDKWGIAVLQ